MKSGASPTLSSQLTRKTAKGLRTELVLALQMCFQTNAMAAPRSSVVGPDPTHDPQDDGAHQSGDENCPPPRCPQDDLALPGLIGGDHPSRGSEPIDHHGYIHESV